MKKMTVVIAASLIGLVGCVNEPDTKVGTPFCDESCEINNEQPTNNVTPSERPKLQGVFVSGHLGSYWDCPEEAFMGPSPGDGDSIDGGACLEGMDCVGFTSCESAQVTITLSNTGDADAVNILVDRIELFGTDGISRAVLPLESTIDTTTNEPFDGNLAVGEDVQLRIEFQGPYDPWTLLQPVDSSNGDRAAGGGGIVKTTFSADNHADLTVESGEIYDVPAVDT